MSPDFCIYIDLEIKILDGKRVGIPVPFFFVNDKDCSERFLVFKVILPVFEYLLAAATH